MRPYFDFCYNLIERFIYLFVYFLLYFTYLEKPLWKENVTFVLISFFVFCNNVLKQRGIKNISVSTKLVAQKVTLVGTKTAFNSFKACSSVEKSKLLRSVKSESQNVNRKNDSLLVKVVKKSKTEKPFFPEDTCPSSQNLSIRVISMQESKSNIQIFKILGIYLGLMLVKR